MAQTEAPKPMRGEPVSNVTRRNAGMESKTWPKYMSRVEVVNAVLSLFEVPRYLEIGVNTGDTFFSANAATKVAVDPAFLFDYEKAGEDNVNHAFHPVVSDVFFGQIIKPSDRFDVIYLDGLHTAEQTFRDFCNAIAFLSEGGIVVIDDVLPSSFHAALPDYQIAWNVRKVLGVEDGMWMGDVYRLVYLIQTFCQQYRYATVTENHGQLIVWRSQRNASEIAARRIEDIGRAPFESVLLGKADFRCLPFGEIMAALSSRRVEVYESPFFGSDRRDC